MARSAALITGLMLFARFNPQNLKWSLLECCKVSYIKCQLEPLEEKSSEIWRSKEHF